MALTQTETKYYKKLSLKRLEKFSGLYYIFNICFRPLTCSNLQGRGEEIRDVHNNQTYINQKYKTFFLEQDYLGQQFIAATFKKKTALTIFGFK